MTYQEKREMMVKDQLIPRGIKDKRLIEVMLKVPRHLFLDEEIRDRAYEDMALPIGYGQTMSQPYMVAIMTELLELKGDERVLEIGTGSGYQAAILSELAREVYTIERIEGLTEKAIERFQSLGYNNIHARTSNGTIGWAEASPFDRIIITAAAPEIPPVLVEQLSENGIAVAPVGNKFSQQLLKIRKKEGKMEEEYHVPCVFVPLIGEFGWQE